ncbi:hypothetical protein BXY64_0651 [Marinifilum flexuosum]|uniref:Uncharacterized protein n=1 Tax=Marinifilum flexuosum TaxID=1117708 RepID=A0A419X7F5_9BACT|nr:hypothetical protein BXY64_0651 [Marinifilum flexuosum]
MTIYPYLRLPNGISIGLRLWLKSEYISTTLLGKSLN